MSAVPPSSKNPNPVALTQGDRGESHDVIQVHAAVLREKPDPKEGFEPLSLWLVAAIAGLLFWGGSYLTQYSGRFEKDEFEEAPHGKSVATSGPEDPVTAQKRKGQVLYNICANCHNDDGAGKPGVAPPLAGSDWVNADGANRIIRIVLLGFTGGPLKINATTEFNVAGAAMPPHADVIGNDENIAAVVTYIRTAWGNTGAPVKADEVKTIRAAVVGRTDPWTPDEILKIPTSGSGAPAAASGTNELSADQLKDKLKALPADQLAKILKELGTK
ncbi:MAG TPA: cytochrome c [Candidatus Limnocylindria bacterium]|jgi:mono/diheme cytochrome c family protein|nr:cytochrome c [Candidatus Limnocylindria bacterium]